jgi:HAMP domain-containing protein
MLAAFGSDAYKIVLVLHILCAIVGFGTVIFNGIYGAQAKARRGKEGLAITQANILVSGIAEYFIYAVFLLGIALVLIGHNVFDFGQTWIWLAMIVFLIALFVSQGLLRPRVNRLEELMQEVVDAGPPQGGPPPQAAEMEKVGGQIGRIAPVLHVALVVILVLMVFKPGGPSV